MCGVSQKIEGEKEVEAIFLDFSKAFDKVDHMKLPYNLDRIGVSKRVGMNSPSRSFTNSF